MVGPRGPQGGQTAAQAQVIKYPLYVFKINLR